MDPPLGCIDPNLFQLNQLFEEVDEAVPAIQTSELYLFPENEDVQSVLELDPKRARPEKSFRESSSFEPPLPVESNYLLNSLNEAESFIAQRAEANGVSFLKRKVPKNFGHSGSIK